MINSNKGMFLEALINQSAIHYFNSKICAIYKRDIPIKIVSNDGNYVKAKLISKSQSDYYAIYKSRLFDFEAKQTMGDDFKIALLKEHQIDHLIKIQDFGVVSFVLIHFIKKDEYYILLTDQLKNFINKSKIEYNWIRQNCFCLQLIFPGILDFEEFFKKYK